MDFDLTILYEQDEEGWWVAEIPEVPGVFSQGRTPEEAREMVLDALKLVLDTRREEASKRGSSARREVMHLAA